MICLSSEAQNKYTREQVLSMSEDQLMELSMDDFAEAIKAVGVSNPDELFAMIMNKNVSSASKNDESTFDSPLSTSVITHDEIRRFGCMSIEEAFRLIPGAIVYEKANGVFDIHLRGLSNIPENNFIYNTDNCNTLMMIDGRQVFNYAAGTTFWESLPIGIDDIDRIEVVRGPASALYGANAVTGVINIITFKGNASQKSVVGNVSYGSNRTSTADVSLRKSFLDDKLFFGASINMQNRERYTDKIYVIPNSGLYVVNDYAAIQNGEGFYYDGMGYDLKTKTAVDNTPNLYISNNYVPVHMSRLQIPYEDLALMIEKGYLTDMSQGGYVDRDVLNDLRYIVYNKTQSNFVKITNATLASYGISSQIPDSLFGAYNALSDYVDAKNLYPDPRMSRDNMGINGYVRFNPNDKVDLALRLGYQRSKAFSSSYRDDHYAMSDRKQETTYIGLNAILYGFNLQADFWGGDQDLCVGFPGYQMEHKQFTAQLDYEFNLLKDADNQSLKIRPGLSLLQYKLNDDEHAHYAPNGEKLSSYLNGECELKSQAVMLRFDYRLNALRIIAAYRAEKLNIPDDWTHTWQLGATYSITENNCIRFVYGRANRSSFAVNSSSNYTYDRTGMYMPDYMTFLANEDAKVMQLDNLEIGFRSRPTPRMLIDAEIFYSMSKNYGALMSNMSQYEVSMANVTAAVKNGVSTSNLDNAQTMFDMLKTRSYMQYENDPCKPKQLGISVGMDWIATDKLIFKMNANWQQTKIYDYSEYSQPQAITAQLTEAATKSAALQQEMAAAMAQGKSLMQYFIDLIFDVPEQYYRYSDSGEIIGINTEKLAADGINVNSLRNGKSNAFGFDVSEDFKNVVLGTSTAMPDWQKKDGYKSKSVPTFYGSLGFIYKPVEQLSVAANCTYMTKREYKIKNPKTGVALPVNDRFLVNLKVGYQPVKGFEVYFNARNIFNNEKQEFVYGDKIGGIYSVGASFEF